MDGTCEKCPDYSRNISGILYTRRLPFCNSSGTDLCQLSLNAFVMVGFLVVQSMAHGCSCPIGKNQ